MLDGIFPLVIPSPPGQRGDVILLETVSRNRAEVAGSHLCGGNCGEVGVAADGLPVPFQPGKEEQLVFHNRAADVEAGEHVLFLGLLQPGVIAPPIGRVQLAVAQIGVRFAVPRGGSRLGNGLDHDRSLALLGAEVGSSDLHFLDHVRVGHDRAVAVASGVSRAGTVADDIQRVVPGARRIVPAGRPERDFAVSPRACR